MAKIDDRKYLLMTSKHSNIRRPLFWGWRTADGDERSFGGYTSNPSAAELYSMNEIMAEFADYQNANLPFKVLDGHLRKYSLMEWLKHTNPEDVFVIEETEVSDDGEN